MELLGPFMDILTSDNARRVEQVVALLRCSRSILFITGAGLSADSGLPTYRGIGIGDRWIFLLGNHRKGRGTQDEESRAADHG
jgi:hypothetical protein